MINRDKGTVTISSNSFLYNAGIVGLLKILLDAEKIRVEDIPYSNTIELPLSVFENFETDYMNAMLNNYGHISEFNNFSRNYRLLDKSNPDSVIGVFKSLNETMKRLSALHVFGIMDDKFFSEHGSELDFKKKKIATTIIQKDISKLLKSYQVKNVSNETKCEIAESLLCKYNELLDEVEKNKQGFVLKDIAYKVINNFWGSKSFLNESNFNKPMDIAYKNSFLDTLEWFLKSKIKKHKAYCMDCGEAFDKMSGKYNKVGVKISNYSWVEDTGIDSAKKTSAFWNFVPDDYMCPICALVYSCVPLGFNVYAEKGFNAFFVNQSTNIRSLLSMNQGLKLQTEEDVSNNRNIFDVYLNSLEDEKMKHNFRSFQTIQRQNKRYLVKTIGEYQIDIFKTFKPEITRLKNKFIKMPNGNFYSVYNEVVSAILDGRSLYPIMTTIVRHYLSDDSYRTHYYKDLLIIQNYINLKKHVEGVDLNMKNFTEKDLYVISNFANMLKEKLVQSNAENKLKSYIYRLESSVRSNNKNRFVSELTRIHTSYSVSLPLKLIEVLREDTDFRAMGNAYIVGLIADKKQKKEEVENEK